MKKPVPAPMSTKASATDSGAAVVSMPAFVKVPVGVGGKTHQTKATPVPMSGHVKSDAKNTCAVLDSGGDHLTIKADLTVPAILLITDNYSRGWQVRSLTPGAQKEYEIMPANYTLMAIPLAAGEHLLLVEYRPLPFVIGAWISAISWIGFGGLLGFVFLRRCKIGKLQGCELRS